MIGGKAMVMVFKYQSPVGILTIAGENDCITGLWIEGQKYYASTLGEEYKSEHLKLFDEVIAWLEVY